MVQSDGDLTEPARGSRPAVIGRKSLICMIFTPDLKTTHLLGRQAPA